MNDDPIIRETREARDEYARRFDYNLDAICKDLQAKQEKPGKQLVSFSGKKPLQSQNTK